MKYNLKDVDIFHGAPNQPNQNVSSEKTIEAPANKNIISTEKKSASKNTQTRKGNKQIKEEVLPKDPPTIVINGEKVVAEIDVNIEKENYKDSSNLDNEKVVETKKEAIELNAAVPAEGAIGAAEEESKVVKTEVVEESTEFKGYSQSHMVIYNIPTEKLVDAPNDWNFFPRINEIKFNEMLDSIRERGLIDPITVWEMDNGKFMILTGHNRRRAFEELYKVTGDAKYKSIFSKIYKKNEIDVEKAKMIIVDSNFVARGELAPSIKAICIQKKFAYLEKYKSNEAGMKDHEQVAKDLNISVTQVYAYRKISKLIPEIRRMLDDKVISLEACGILADYSADLQKKLAHEYGTYLNNRRIMSLRKIKDESRVIYELTKEDAPVMKVTSVIPKSKYNEFISYIDEWKRNNCI